MWRAVKAVGPIFREDGLTFVGLDFVGDRIIEINAYSPGGLPDAELFFERPFLSAIADVIEAKARP
jgi:glutathione synthase